MKKTVLMLAVSLVALLALTACGTTEVTTVMEQQRTLSAAGNGVVYIVPDIAYINVGVRVDADAVSDALAANNIQANSIADALQELGVEKSDIQTSNFNVYPMQDWGPDGQISRKYYVVENTVMITVRDLSKLGQLLDTVVSSGANTINGISFDVQDKATAEAEARDKAIEDAKAEAQAIAAASGVSLGEIQTVNVYTNGVSYPMYESKGLGGGAAYDASVPISAGQLKISADANIVFIIN
jgi:uncharacterized protein YggE